MGFPTLDFNGVEGQRSTGAGSPDAIEGDLQDIARMFDPGATLKSGQPGGIGTINVQDDAITSEKIKDGEVKAVNLDPALLENVAVAAHRTMPSLDHPSGSVHLTHLAEEVLVGVGGGAGVELYADDAAFSGTKEADALTWKGTAVVANTSTSGSVQLTQVITTKLKLGLHSIILRMRSANNVLTPDLITVTVAKNVGGSFVDQVSKNFKATAFASTTDFDTLYVLFEYKGGRATNDQIRITVTLLTAASVFEVGLDSITVLPTGIGIVV